MDNKIMIFMVIAVSVIIILIAVQTIQIFKRLEVLNGKITILHMQHEETVDYIQSDLATILEEQLNGNDMLADVWTKLQELEEEDQEYEEAEYQENDPNV